MAKRKPDLRPMKDAPPKRRGRPPGSKTKKPQGGARTPIDTSGYHPTGPIKSRDVAAPSGRKFKLETNVPLPTAQRGVCPYPLTEMKVGESFLVKRTEHAKVAYHVGRAHRENPGSKYAVRQTEKGDYRVFRMS